MHEIRMEVCSENEAFEICEANGYTFGKLYVGKGSNAGKLMMLAYGYNENEQMSMFDNITVNGIASPRIAKAPPKKKAPESEKVYSVRTIVNGGYMYITNTGTTFYPSGALLMTEEQARKKAFFMSKKGYYNWESVKMK